MPVPRVPANKARARVLWRVARGLRGEAMTARYRNRRAEGDVLDEAAALVEWLAIAEYDEQIPGQGNLFEEVGG